MKQEMNRRTIVDSFAAHPRQDTIALVSAALVILFSRWLFLHVGPLLALAAFAAATLYLSSGRGMDRSRLRFDVDQLADRLIAAVDWVDGQVGPPPIMGYFGASTGAAEPGAGTSTDPDSGSDMDTDAGSGSDGTGVFTGSAPSGGGG